MDAVSQVTRAVRALGEVHAALARAPASPRTREFKVRASTFERALMNLAGRTPRPEQAAALLEGVLDLHAKVMQFVPPTRSPSLPGIPASPSLPKMRSVLTSSRMGLPGLRPSQRPTAKPPPGTRTPEAGTPTVPPPSTPRR